MVGAGARAARRHPSARRRRRREVATAARRGGVRLRVPPVARDGRRLGAAAAPVRGNHLPLLAQAGEAPPNPDRIPSSLS